jgi:hypothetical protein
MSEDVARTLPGHNQILQSNNVISICGIDNAYRAANKNKAINSIQDIGKMKRQ